MKMKSRKLSAFFRSARDWRVFRWSKDYFPISLVKTCDLDPETNYVCGNHPHGVMCFGSFTVFGTNALDWDGLFPSVKRRLVILDLVFSLPGFREIALAVGGIAASQESIRHVLRYYFLCSEINDALLIE